MTVFSISPRSTVWTADRFCRNTDGKEEAFVVVVIVFEAVSRKCQKCEIVELLSMQTFIFRATAIAEEDSVLVTGRTIQKIAAICAKYERPNCRHFESAVHDIWTRLRKKINFNPSLTNKLLSNARLWFAARQASVEFIKYQTMRRR